ncbi:MAG: GNAT family N-acetyltransferase [Oscillospiraceae bacterium]|nr:GNAT family N-acetyltransferase [Oscillospiraceae bacterium]
MKIRYLLPSDDAMAVSRIYEESWKYAYKGIIPQSYLEAIPAGRWAQNAEIAPWKTLVCVENGVLAGTACFCGSRFQQFEGWGEVVSLYLLPGYMGKGYGKSLLKRAVSELEKQGYEDIFLWVLEENERARHFYEQFGFLPAGDVLEDNIGGRNLREVRYIYQTRWLRD